MQRFNGSMFENLILLQGDYDLVITDYTRVKSLFGDTEIKVFRKGKIIFSIVRRSQNDLLFVVLVL